MAGPSIGLQLYTLRELTKVDFAGTMKEVKKIGYDWVELAGYGNLKTAAEAKKALDDAGVKVSGAHAPIGDLETKIDALLDDCELFGHTLLICPFMPEDRRKDAAGWKQVAQSLAKAGRACHERGIDLAYHNHSFEFQKFDGANGLDLLFDNSPAHLVKAELDVYWVRHGQEDPVAYQIKLGDRTVALHLKDMADGPDRRFAPVGTGLLDFKAILDAASKAGTRWGIVEQDQTYDTPPLEAIRVSRENLRKLGF